MAPEELSAHVQFMRDFAARLVGTGEFVDSQARSPDGRSYGAVLPVGPVFMQLIANSRAGGWAR